MPGKNTSINFFSLIAALLVFSSTLAQAQTNSPAPVIPDQIVSAAPKIARARTYIQVFEQPFAELIEDAIVDTNSQDEELLVLPSCELRAPCSGTCENDCVCFAKPDEMTPTEVEEAYEEVDEWAELMTCPCTVHSCNSEKPFLSPHAAPPKAELVSGPENYCLQLARLLGPTLESDSLTSEKKQQAIQATMKMVAEKALESAEARMAEMEIAHRNEVALLQKQLAAATASSNSQQLVEAWLRPILAKQRSNEEQIRRMVQATKSMGVSISMWESRMSALTESVTPEPVPTPTEHVVPAAYAYYGLEQEKHNGQILRKPRQTSSLPLHPIPQPSTPLKPIVPAKDSMTRTTSNEVEELRAELQAMRVSQLKLLQRLHVADRRAADLETPEYKKLEPLYVPDARLLPIQSK